MIRILFLMVAMAGVLSACGWTQHPTGESSKPAPAAGDGCPRVGSWLVSGEKTPMTTKQVLQRIAGKRVILLTEMHDRPDHHRWQLQALVALHAAEPDMAIGFEMFPRDAQAALDRWVAGELDEVQFLRQAQWWRHWGFDPDLYLPLFHFARINGVEMRALNLERSIVARVAGEGLAAVPSDERGGVGDPAPLSSGYLDRLLEAYREHLPEGERAEVDRDDRGFQHFTEAQALRDRAMAEALRAALTPRAEAPARRQVIAILGRGHADHGHGVPGQLAALGIGDAAVLTPWSLGEDCVLPPADLADAVFLLPAESPAREPRRLGVHLEPAEQEQGLGIAKVRDDSAAAAAGLMAGDRIVEAAGQPVAELVDLQIAIWQTGQVGALPLVVVRNGEARELLVRFR
jgi:uncharacterized iron-regulated protein